MLLKNCPKISLEKLYSACCARIIVKRLLKKFVIDTVVVIDNGIIYAINFLIRSMKNIYNDKIVLTIDENVR